MRLSIKRKIILLGAGISFLLILVAFLVSSYVYKQRSQSALNEEVNRSIKEIEKEIDKTYMVDAVMEIKGHFLDAYDLVADDYKSEFADWKEELAYYQDTYSFIYDKPGVMGLSQDKARMRTNYYVISGSLSSAMISSGGQDAFIAYFDEARGRMFYLIEYNYTISSPSEEGKPLGSFYQLRETDTYDLGNDDETKEFYINGQKARMIRLNKVNDDSGETKYVANIVLIYNEDKLNQSINSFFFIELISLSISFIILGIIYIILSDRLIVNNLMRLNDSTKEFTKKITDGDKLEIIEPNIKSRDEIKDLSVSFITLEHEIMSYLDRIEEATKEREKINAELQVASQIQLESLPKGYINDKNILASASITSAKEVGGDFYDYFYIDDKHLALIISDVSGKGIPASLFMMRGKTLIKAKLNGKKPLDQVCYEVNNELLENNEAGLFITSFIGIIDIETKKLQFVNAGHERPYIIGDDVKQIECSSNFIFGGISDFNYQVEELQLHENEKIFLFTDGLNESINNEYQEFGYDNITKVLKENIKSQNKDIISNMKSALKEFTAGQEPFDDVTMLLIELKSKKLSFHFENPSYEIIEEVTNRFNDYYSYIDSETISTIDIIYDELLNNYVSYEKAEHKIIEVNIDVTEEEVRIEFKCNGEKFNPLEREEKYVESMENLAPGGLGITIVKQMTDSMTYKREKGFNVLNITKKYK